MKNFWKKIAITLTLVMTFALCFAFVGCGEDEERKTIDEFAEYMSLNSTYDDAFFIDTKTATMLNYLEKEETSPYRVWLHLSYNQDINNNYDGIYKWLQKSPEQKKKDLKSIGDKYIAFAKEKKYNNNYYLYVTLSYQRFETDVQTIYDYGKDKLYVPNCDHFFLEMYEKFKSCSDYEIKDMQGGADWLVSKGLGEYKHGEFELFYTNTPLVSMRILCNDGKFTIRDANKSTAY